MFGVDSTELILVAVLALLFIGPKELPTAMRSVGRWIGKVRGMARHFTSGFEDLVREAELEEMERKWSEENDRIMREYPALPDDIAAAEGAAPETARETDPSTSSGQAEADQPALPLPPPDERRELP
jgi:sec-independent protein translocase protein TatB